MSDFDGQTPDQLRAAEKRAAAARAAAGLGKSEIDLAIELRRLEPRRLD